jgi:hypothetical protein
MVARLSRRHATRDELVRAHLEVESQLDVHVFLHPRSPMRQTEETTETMDSAHGASMAR